MSKYFGLVYQKRVQVNPSSGLRVACCVLSNAVSNSVLATCIPQPDRFLNFSVVPVHLQGKGENVYLSRGRERCCGNFYLTGV